MDTMRVAPFSTFEIMGALVGLQTGASTSEKMVMDLDSMVCEGNDTCKNMDMAAAFQSGCSAYFEQLAVKTGKDKLKYWIDSIGYGNKQLEGPIENVWTNGSLRISSDEQLGLMKRLYFDQLPFRKTVQETVRQMMLQEDNSAYRLSYKTGNGVNAQKQPISWICGWIEENKHVYFFVTLLQNEQPGELKDELSVEIARDILAHYGFFKGKK
jgi:beta-lactamase class D